KKSRDSSPKTDQLSDSPWPAPTIGGIASKNGGDGGRYFEITVLSPSLVVYSAPMIQFHGPPLFDDKRTSSLYASAFAGTVSCSTPSMTPMPGMNVVNAKFESNSPLLLTYDVALVRRPIPRFQSARTE